MSDFLNQDELQKLILLYRNNIEQIRENHDNLLSMMVAVVSHYGGEIQIPITELEDLGQGTPFTIRMKMDDAEENMVISVERVNGDETELSELSGGPDDSDGTGGRTKFHA